ncbi:MAG: hypothetical protein K0R85_403 [Devosia sp.]|jgi:integrase|nr:hypothetical protein [Devosia sp.]
MASVAKREWTYKGEKRSAWVVRYHDGKAHRSKQFEKKKEADEYKRKVERETDAGTHVADGSTVTVRQLAEEYLRFEELRLKDGRIGQGHMRNAKTIVDNSVIPHIGLKPVRDIRGVDVEDWYNAMVKVQRLKPSTAKYRVQFCGVMFELALRRGYTKVNPLTEGQKLLRGIKRDPIRTFSVSEIGAIINAANERRYKGRHRTQAIARCFVHLAAFCGLRYGEIAGLTLQRVNFEARVIEVRHNLTQFDELKAPKTKAGNRDVPLPPHIAVLLHEFIDEHYVPNDRNLIFRVHEQRVSRVPAGFIKPENFRGSYWKPILQRAGIDVSDGVPHFHALRHFAASWMIANGISLMDTATLLGHREFDTTLQIYAHDVATKTQRLAAFDTMATRLLAAPL